MAWIESHQTLKEHPKLYVLMDILKIGNVQAVGHLHFLWWWCVDYAPNGQLKHTAVQISRAANWEGNFDIFLEALIEAGFIDKKENCLEIHDWLDFCGALVERRLKRLDDKTNKVAAVRKQVAAVRPPTKSNHNKPATTNQPSQSNQPRQLEERGPSRRDKMGAERPPTQPNPTQPKERGFYPPAVFDVKNYCAERKNSVDPEKFVNFYQSKDWMIGKNKMKDWKAAVRTWEKRNQDGKPEPTKNFL